MIDVHVAAASRRGDRVETYTGAVARRRSRKRRLTRTCVVHRRRGAPAEPKPRLTAPVPSQPSWTQHVGLRTGTEATWHMCADAADRPRRAPSAGHDLLANNI